MLLTANLLTASEPEQSTLQVLLSTLNEVDLGIGVINRYGEFIFANENWKGISDHERNIKIDSWEGLNYTHLCRQTLNDETNSVTDESSIESILKAVKKVQSDKTEATTLTLEHDNSNRYSEVTIRKFDSVNAQDLILLSHRDITEIKQQTQELASERNRYRTRARFDELTGLYRRGYFLESLEDEIERSKRYNHTFSLILCDLDEFKKVNDTYGHQAGDDILERIGDLLRIATREPDITGRYGGEEFGIILPETSLKGAKILADRIRESTKHENFESDRLNDDFQLTCSLGIAEWAEGSSLDQLLQAADDALYQAKNGGRDKVCSASV